MEPTDGRTHMHLCWGEPARRDTAGEETAHATCIGPAGRGRAASVDRGKEGVEFASRPGRPAVSFFHGLGSGTHQDIIMRALSAPCPFWRNHPLAFRVAMMLCR